MNKYILPSIIILIVIISCIMLYMYKNKKTKENLNSTFNSHWMYHPTKCDRKWARKYEDHLNWNEKGYIHEPLQKCNY
jgi:hypothetical protein